jgi:hypothetical protein
MESGLPTWARTKQPARNSAAGSGVSSDVKRHATVCVALAAGVLVAPSAEAKFSISLAVAPTPLWAKQPARVTIRTGIVLPREHGLRLQAVGPGAIRYETTFFDVRLRRTGPKTYKASVHFPRGGRWRLIVPNWGAPGAAVPPPVDRAVRVRPSP